MILAYDGRAFAGSQAQAHGNTVQDVLEAAIALTAKVMCDDGANIYLNGGSPTPIRMNAGATAYADLARRPDRLMTERFQSFESLLKESQSIAEENAGQWLSSALPVLPLLDRDLDCPCVNINRL